MEFYIPSFVMDDRVERVVDPVVEDLRQLRVFAVRTAGNSVIVENSDPLGLLWTATLGVRDERSDYTSISHFLIWPEKGGFRVARKYTRDGQRFTPNVGVNIDLDDLYSSWAVSLDHAAQSLLEKQTVP